MSMLNLFKGSEQYEQGRWETYEFKPLLDITAFELATILTRMHIGGEQGGAIGKIGFLKEQPPEHVFGPGIARHFHKVEDEHG
jgi:hypothetical protein